MRNIELPLSASFVHLCTITVRPPVNAGFVDVFEQARQHLLRAPPRLHHVPPVLHLFALVVIEEPVLDITIYHCYWRKKLAQCTKENRVDQCISL